MSGWTQRDEEHAVGRPRGSRDSGPRKLYRRRARCKRGHLRKARTIARRRGRYEWMECRECGKIRAREWRKSKADREYRHQPLCP